MSDGKKKGHGSTDERIEREKRNVFLLIPDHLSAHTLTQLIKTPRQIARNSGGIKDPLDFEKELLLMLICFSTTCILCG